MAWLHHLAAPRACRPERRPQQARPRSPVLAAGSSSIAIIVVLRWWTKLTAPTMVDCPTAQPKRIAGVLTSSLHPGRRAVQSPNPLASASRQAFPSVRLECLSASHADSLARGLPARGIAEAIPMFVVTELGPSMPRRFPPFRDGQRCSTALCSATARFLNCPPPRPIRPAAPPLRNPLPSPRRRRSRPPPLQLPRPPSHLPSACRHRSPPTPTTRRNERSIHRPLQI